MSSRQLIFRSKSHITCLALFVCTQMDLVNNYTLCTTFLPPTPKILQPSNTT